MKPYVHPPSSFLRHRGKALTTHLHLAANLLVGLDKSVVVVHHDPTVAFIFAVEPKGNLHSFILRKTLSKEKQTASLIGEKRGKELGAL